LAARLFVRGSKLADAMAAGARLAARGRATTLGYFNADGDAPRAVADACLAALDAIAGVGTGAATRDAGVATSGAGAAAGAAPSLSVDQGARAGLRRRAGRRDRRSRDARLGRHPLRFARRRRSRPDLRGDRSGGAPAAARGERPRRLAARLHVAGALAA